MTPSWGALPPSAVAIPTSAVAVTLNTFGDASGTGAITANEIDWYRFSTTGGATAFTAWTPTSNLNTVIGIYNAAGQRVAYNNNANAYNTDSRTVANLAAGTYYVGITNLNFTPGGTYSWAVEGPSQPAQLRDDAYENNDTQAIAYNFGTLSSTRTVSGLVMADAMDWYRFTTVATGTSSHRITINFNNALGNLNLQILNASGTVLASSQGVGNSETVSLAGLPAGTYWFRVWGVAATLNPSYSLSITPPTLPPPPSPPTGGGFQITLRTSGLTPTQQAIFQQAADRWAQVITGDLPDMIYNGTTVDDLLIDASVTPIDGIGGILGQAGPDSFRAGTLLPYHGVMEFDTADFAALEASGGLFYTVLHEMGHVLGIGTLWSPLGLLTGAGTSNPLFVGPQALAAYNAIFGTTATGVPVENTGGAGTRDGHWRESIFDNEVMTGYLNSGVNPLSRVTVGSLADMGYTVNMAPADVYVPLRAVVTSPEAKPSAGTPAFTVGLLALTAAEVVAPPVAAPSVPTILAPAVAHTDPVNVYADPFDVVGRGIRVDGVVGQYLPVTVWGEGTTDGIDVIKV